MLLVSPDNRLITGSKNDYSIGSIMINNDNPFVTAAFAMQQIVISKISSVSVLPVLLPPALQIHAGKFRLEKTVASIFENGADQTTLVGTKYYAEHNLEYRIV
jgi:hypothetical protein